MYLIVFDLSRLCAENDVNDELGLLESWIERVVTYTEDEGQVAPMLLIGTHYDQLHNSGDHDIAKVEEQINEKIKQLVEKLTMKTKTDHAAPEPLPFGDISNAKCAAAFT